MSEQVIVKETEALTATDMRKQVNRIQEIMKAVMIGPTKDNPEGVHYGIIPGTKKPTLLKPGAEKIAMTFRLGCEFDELPGSVESDAFICYKINCQLIHTPTGQIVGNGRGTCNSKEKKYLTRMVYADRATDEEKAIGKPETRTGKGGKTYDVYIVPQNPWDLQNTIYKMACKRALVAAILIATAASDIFTQDVEDLPVGTIPDPEKDQREKIPMPERKQTEKPAEQTPPATTGQAGASSVEYLISEKQAKRLFAIMRKANVNEADLKSYLKDAHGIEHSRDIPKSVYEQICTWTENGGQAAVTE